MKNVPVRYFSTSLSSPEVTFSQALMTGLAPDGGLYMPLSIPVLKSSDIAGFSSLYYAEIAARVMARMMQYFNRRTDRNLIILVATSGDTGSAIASAFHKLEGVEVVILYPHAEVSDNQRRQMTTMGDNVRVLSVEGKFDDCQNMVKQAFRDRELAHLSLSSANSINIGRLLPQAVYYFYAWSRVVTPENNILFAVPSGNLGNITGGLIAMRMGLPVRRFIVATNSNDEFPRYLQS